VSEAKTVLRALGSRPIAYHPAIAKALGSVNAALVVCQLLYWDGKGSLEDGWIVKTNAEFQDELGMTEHELETARRKCREAGVLTFERKGMPARGHYQLDLDALLDLLVARSSEAESAQLDRRNAPDQSAGKRPSSEAGHKGNLLGGKRLTISESTAESTAEKSGSASASGGARSKNFASWLLTSEAKRIRALFRDEQMADDNVERKVLLRVFEAGMNSRQVQDRLTFLRSQFDADPKLTYWPGWWIAAMQRDAGESAEMQYRAEHGLPSPAQMAVTMPP
jgi:hypothetical protein